MSYTDPNNPNDPLGQPEDPVRRDTHHTTVVDRRGSGGTSWFIVGALVIAGGVLAYLYFGDRDSSVAERPDTAIEGEADTGRAATDAPPAGMNATQPPAPAAPAEPADNAPANMDSAPGANTPASPQPTTPQPAQ